MPDRRGDDRSGPVDGERGDPPRGLEAASADAELRGRLILHGLLNNLGPVVAALTGLATVPVMLWGLGNVDYGLWIIVISISGLVMSLDLGLGLMVTREVARCAGAGEAAPSRTARAAGGGLLAMGLLGWSAMTVIGLVAAVAGGSFRGQPTPGVAVFTLVGLTLLLDQVVQYGVAVLAGRERFGLSNLVLALGALTRLSLIVVALMLRGDLEAVAVAYSLSALATALLATAVVRRVDPGHGVLSTVFDLRTLRPQVRFGLGTLVATVGGAVLWHVHPLLIGTLIGPAAVVAYHVGMRPAMLLSAINWRTAEVLFPAVSRAGGESRDARGVGVALSTGVRWLTFVVTPVALVSAMVAPALLRLWLPEVPEGAVGILRLAMAVVLLDAWSVAAMQVLWGLGRVDRIAAAMTVSAILAVLTDVALLPVLGALAAPVAILLGLTVMVVVSLPAAAVAAATPVSRILLRDVASLVPAATACAAGSFLGARLGGASDVWTVALGAVFGLGAYLLASRFTPALQEERSLVRERFGALTTGGRRGLGKVRAHAKGISVLRSAWYLLIVLRRRVAYRSASTSASLNRLFEASPDPWEYTSAAETSRHQRAESLLSRIPREGGLDQVAEIGCAEGAFTERLAPLCRSLLALDVSPVALEHARTRAAWSESTRFQQFDLLRGSLPGPFTTIVVMDVLTYFESVSELKAIREKIVDALAPGGWLLVGDVRQVDVYETSWWGRKLVCGGYWICEFMAAHRGLRLVTSDETDTHVFRLLRKED